MYASDGSITQVHAYTADLLIRNASDGKKYLYDIVNIKNDVIKADSLLKRETARRAKDAAKLKDIISDSSIRPNRQNVNSEIKNQSRDPEEVSNREILMNALKGAAKDITELSYLMGHKKELTDLDA